MKIEPWHDLLADTARVETAEFRAQVGDMLDRVHYTGVSIIVQSRAKLRVGVVGLKEMALLKLLEQNPHIRDQLTEGVPGLN